MIEFKFYLEPSQVMVLTKRFRCESEEIPLKLKGLLFPKGTTPTPNILGKRNKLLYAVYQLGQCTFMEAITATGLNKSTAFRIWKALVVSGYLVPADANKFRNTDMMLTDKGLEFIKESERVVLIKSNEESEHEEASESAEE